jgi:hypothetical protein
LKTVGIQPTTTSSEYDVCLSSWRRILGGY